MLAAHLDHIPETWDVEVFRQRIDELPPRRVATPPPPRSPAAQLAALMDLEAIEAGVY